ncbi:MAG TPA: hypothetical protein PKY77_03260 [Phycisphaerae bacterium]|nr:hypothetical protein [Phycisphaerae bacterium]HRY67382.1 hypothetical protein [Phycisphaerae bacterium]HSA29326.1 hypothetical protein [Phycisphaerae bacterium]
MTRLIAAMTVLILASATAVQAEITYVDATPNGEGVNVTVQGATPTEDAPANFMLDEEDSGSSPAESDTDGIWGERNRTAMNGGNVLVARGVTDGTDDGNGILWTSTPTLTAGTYNVYLFFWINSNGNGIWDISAAIGELNSFDGLTDYTKNNATNISGAALFDGYDLPTTLKKADGAQHLFAVKLGQVVLSSDGEITVSTAGRLQTTSDNRTWFDGIGYQKVETCADLAVVTIQKPVAPGAATVTVTGVSPEAESVNVYLDPATLIGSAAGSPPNTPANLTVTLSRPAAFNEVLLSRQVVGGIEQCGAAPTTRVVVPRITYVDAVPNTTGSDGNTTVDGVLVDLVALPDDPTGNVATGGDVGGPGDDGLWYLRPRPMTNAKTVWEAPEVVSPLVTTLSLAAGTYQLYGLFWNNASNDGAWDVAFRVGSGNPLVFGKGNATLSTPDGSEFTNVPPVSTRDATQWMLIAPLGEYEITGPIEIRIDSPQQGVSDDPRTWYDGIGYELVSPASPLPVSDGFGDGDRNNDGLRDDPDGSGSGLLDDPADVGLQWWRVFRTGSENQIVRVAHDLVAPDGLGDDNALQVSVTGNQAYQVASLPPTLLANAGESIRLTAQVRFTSMTDYRDTLRFGLLNQGVTSVTLDQLTPAIIEDDCSYFATVATGAVGAAARIAANSSGGADGSIFGLDENIVTENPFSRMINDNLPHSLSLTVIHAFGDSALIDYSIDGSTALRGHDPSFPVFYFNGVGFGSVPSPGISYHLDDVLIESGVATTCQAIPSVTVESIIPSDATDVVVNGIVPQAERVNVYLDGNLIGSATGSPPGTPATLTVPITASPPLSGLVTARQVVNGVESCWTASGVQVNNCAAVGAVSIQGALVGDTTVTVVGIDATATTVNVYANGTTLIGTAPTEEGAASVIVTVSPLRHDARISATQIIRRVESCMPTGVQVISGRITYVDAVPNTTGTDGNTTLDGVLADLIVLPDDPTGNVTTAGVADDNLWNWRSIATNGDRIWETDTSGTVNENTGLLKTTLSLAAGSYDLYGIFWNNSPSSVLNDGVWDIGFRVGETGAFSVFTKANTFLASDVATHEFADSSPPVVTRQGTQPAQVLLIAPLGRFEITGPIDIYVDASGTTSASDDERTWYDGIGYVAACPSPFADTDGDRDVDQQDFGVFQLCYTGSSFSGVLPFECGCLDHVPDGKIDLVDLAAFVDCVSGPAIAADPSCGD